MLDFLDMKNKSWIEAKQRKIRHIVHLSFAFILFFLIILFRIINNEAVINELFTIAGYTYGPLLGLFAFGLLTNKLPSDKMVPLVCVLSPIICYILNKNSVEYLNGYKFGFELLILNGALTFAGLVLISRSQNKI